MRAKSSYYRSRYRQRKRRWQSKIFIWLFLFAVFSFVKVWQKTNIDYQYRRNDLLKMELNALQSENALLAAQIEELRSADRLTTIAAERLHMTYIPRIQLQEKTMFEKLTAKLDKLQK